MPDRLTDRFPEMSQAELIAQLVPPPIFDGATFDSYHPVPGEPTQVEAVKVAKEFVNKIGSIHKGQRKWGMGKRTRGTGAGIYLDGGFGVGKTHLLASAFREAPEPKSFGTFVELTHTVGALGYMKAVEEFKDHSLLCIDEFELDDPGDTMLISRLLTELSAQGVSIAVTSNTLPHQLGEGRFAAADFMREIKKLGDIFQSIRVDGPDYRHRDLPPAPKPATTVELKKRAAETPGATLDDWDSLCAHLTQLHPSRYLHLIDGVSTVFISDIKPVTDQGMALRIVVLADRLYDASIPVVASGTPLDKIFPKEMLEGGYRKKYLRAISRLLALSRRGNTAV
ncbi:cell division protein ZapE [Smaragdicoccus niigatensis]|uniref:cell division protein ZapE n=1 Tax=Smaragdicoccus niigatensis TaxID=359359 RepID=UPI0003A7906B|nr:cell division protein ZapE [Smaragdicoccus niigatensis]